MTTQTITTGNAISRKTVEILVDGIVVGTATFRGQSTVAKCSTPEVAALGARTLLRAYQERINAGR